MWDSYLPPARYFLLQNWKNIRHSRCFDWLSHMIALFEVQFLLNFLPLFQNIYFLISLSFILYNEIYEFIQMSVLYVNTYPVILLYNSYMSRFPRKCYCCAAKSYILELYLQFRVRELFSLFWQGSWFRMSDGKL